MVPQHPVNSGLLSISPSGGTCPRIKYLRTLVSLLPHDVSFKDCLSNIYLKTYGIVCLNNYMFVGYFKTLNNTWVTKDKWTEYFQNSLHKLIRKYKSLGKYVSSDMKMYIWSTSSGEVLLKSRIDSAGNHSAMIKIINCFYYYSTRRAKRAVCIPNLNILPLCRG